MGDNQQLKVATAELHSQLRWSPRMKHSIAEINGRVLNLTADAFNRYGFLGTCGLTSGLSEATNNGKLKWSIRINALEKWMYIGICQIRQTH